MAASDRLSVEARTLIDGASEAFISEASLIEMALKQASGRLRMDLTAFAKHAEATGFRWLDIRHDHLFALARLAAAPGHHNACERMLVAQSMTEPLILVTATRALEHYGATIRVV